MKRVHTKIVISMTTGEELKDEFYWYDGEWEECKDFDIEQVFTPPSDPVNILSTVTGAIGAVGAGVPGFFSGGPAGALTAGGIGFAAGETLGRGAGSFFFPDVDDDDFIPPAPPVGSSPGEINQFNADLQDFQLNQAGFARVPRQGGGFQFVEIPDAQLNAIVGQNRAEQIRADRNIRLLGSQRTEAALRGDLPISPGFERGARRRSQAARLRAARGAGAGSTPGAQQLALQQESDEIIREQIRTGQITSGQATSLQQQQVNAGLQNQFLQNIQQGQQFGAQLGFGQQNLATQLQIAQLAGQFGEQAGQQELLGTIAGASIPGLIGLLK